MVGVPYWLNPLNLPNPFSWWSSSEKNTGKNDNCLPKKGEEKLNAPSSEINPQSDEEQVRSVLLDFEKLDFENNPCNDASDVINYNEGKEANPFDKIANYYGRKKNVFLFISMLRDEEQSEKILDIISKKCNVQARNQFEKRMNVYLNRIDQGERDAREFLNSNDFPDTFFSGPNTGENQNIYQNLNIKIKPGQTLETSSLFNKNSELEREKIYNEKGERILTIEKNEKQQRTTSLQSLQHVTLQSVGV